jgi:ribosomal protein S18 acetylase RimI-like enzyme
MSEPVVRKARKSDFEKVKGFVKEHWEKGFPEVDYNKVSKYAEASFKNHVGKEGTFVLTMDDEIIGYLSVGVSKNKELNLLEGELYMIHIKKEFRGKGYAHLMMKTAENYFKRKNPDYCVISTHIDNEVSQSLYKKDGYKPWRITLKRWNK